MRICRDVVLFLTSRDTALRHFPLQKGSKTLPVVENCKKILQNIREKAGFSIDIAFWI